MLHTENVAKSKGRIVPADLLGEKTVGKAELCKLIGYSRPWLDRRLESDPDFPVVERGKNRRGWEFRLSAVKAHLTGESPETIAPVAAVPAIAPLPASLDRDTDDAGAQVPDVLAITAKNRRDAAQAGLLEDKLRISRGELVEVEDFRSALSTMLSHLSKGLEQLPDQITEQLGLSPAHGLTVRNVVNKLRQNMVEDLRQLLPPV